ncbi:hypothetical protein U1Q18_000689 [Sarracenia purpurea var. burkii]
MIDLVETVEAKTTRAEVGGVVIRVEVGAEVFKRRRRRRRSNVDDDEMQKEKDQRHCCSGGEIGDMMVVQNPDRRVRFEEWSKV